MDSGAFSAFTLGEETDLELYCHWLKQHVKYIEHYAVLDVIGSGEASASGTRANQQRMHELATRPVPCFHYGEPLEYLEGYINDGHEYIALGGMVPISTQALLPWLDDLFENYLTNDRGEPIIKVHGFGLTTFELMDRYPWFSVDSSSWLKFAHFGWILFYSQGKVVKVSMSAKSGKTGILGQHYQTETRANREAIDRIILDLGFEPAALAEHYQVRDSFNAGLYVEYGRRWQPKPFRNPHSGLFSLTTSGQRFPKEAAAVGWPWAGLEMYLAGEVTMEVERRIHELGVNRMFSYHYVGKKSTKQWRAHLGCRDGLPFPETKDCQS